MKKLLLLLTTLVFTLALVGCGETTEDLKEGFYTKDETYTQAEVDAIVQEVKNLYDEEFHELYDDLRDAFNEVQEVFDNRSDEVDKGFEDVEAAIQESKSFGLFGTIDPTSTETLEFLFIENTTIGFMLSVNQWGVNLTYEDETMAIEGNGTLTVDVTAGVQELTIENLGDQELYYELIVWFK